MRIVVGVLLVIALLDRASAQPAPAPVSPPSSKAPTATEPVAQTKEDAALVISLGATLASWTVMLIGLESNHGPTVVLGGVATVILPSAGHWYVRESGALGLAMRAVGATGLTWAVIKDGRCNDEGCEVTNAQRAILLGGFGLYIAGTIVDIATAPAAARRHHRATHNLAIAPVLQPTSAGLVITGAF